MERKLASVQIIKDLRPISNADQIEVATVLGWHVVVRKGDFNVGDLCVYVEIDAILPERPEFEFMRSRGFRVKTIRLRKQISQGICFPLQSITLDLSAYATGDDVTNLLGIVKYEPPISPTMGGDTVGNFPDFLYKTDEMRIQAVPGVLGRHPDVFCYVTEKLDGTSFTVYNYAGHFGVCSRNWEKDVEGNTVYAQIARTLRLAAIVPAGYALQGEIIGPKIQRNKYKRHKLEAYFFDVLVIDDPLRMDYHDMRHCISDELGLNLVPVLHTAWLLPRDVDTLVDMAKGASQLCATKREGIVVRSMVNNVTDPDLGRLSFKVVNPDFLLKQKS